MDVDNSASQQRSSKYSQPAYNGSKAHDTGRMLEDRSRRTSSSSRNRAQRTQPQYNANSTTSGSAYNHRGATNAPPPSSSAAAPNGRFAPPPYKAPAPPTTAPLASAATPPESAQPSFPPPAVTSDSPQPSEAAQRRPAYLLHRDLVIGKGSYGQVCIASRGEPEGHSAGRSGKRKKFACKCVMLRNDPKYIAKLQEEVNVLRELRGHDNVIRLYDVFCVDNELFIITELGRGGDLFHLLTTHPKHGVTEAYAGKNYCICRLDRLLFLFRRPHVSTVSLLLCFFQPKRSRKCFPRWHFCILAAFVTET